MRGRATGFSILELLVVMAVVGVVLGYLYPRLPVLVSKYRLDNSAWNLATDLQKVRLRAIGETSRFRIVFNTSTRTYQVQKETAGVFTNDGAARQIDDANAVTLAATASPIFTSRGSVETGAVVTLGGASGGVRLVAVQLPGRINVQ